MTAVMLTCSFLLYSSVGNIDTYQIELPADLPPSHRGKTIRFSYNLVLGVQRGSVHTPAKSVQLPFRLYNNISELGTRPVYDLMSPVILHKDTAISGVVGQSRPSEKSAENPSRFMKINRPRTNALSGQSLRF